MLYMASYMICQNITFICCKWFVKYLSRHVFLATKLNFHNIFKHLVSGISVIKLYIFNNVIRIALFISNKVPWPMASDCKKDTTIYFRKSRKLQKMTIA